MRLPVAIQFYTVRDEAEKDFFGTLQKIKDMGYEGVEFAGLFGNSPELVRDKCREIGLIPVSAHVPLDEMIADPEGVAKTYSAIGCRFIAVPYVTEERRPGAELFEKTLEDIKDVGAVMNRYGITLCYHNHDFEFKVIDGKYGLDVIYERVPAELLQTELDVCWVSVGGPVPQEYVLKYSGRAPLVHLKDYVSKSADKPKKLYDLIGIEDEGETASEDDFSFMPVGHGTIDMPAVMKAAVQAGAEWLIVEQDRPEKGNTPMGAAKMSIDYIKAQF